MRLKSYFNREQCPGSVAHILYQQRKFSGTADHADASSICFTACLIQLQHKGESKLKIKGIKIPNFIFLRDSLLLTVNTHHGVSSHEI